MSNKEWWIFKGTGEPHDDITRLPSPPGWRTFADASLLQPHPTSHDEAHFNRHLGQRVRGAAFQASDEEIELVNAALYLRRPLLLTGKPGSGKSSLAYAVAYELKLGEVLLWSITTRTTWRDGLYQYDAVGRLRDASLKNDTPDIGRYISLGPLGTALLPSRYPRVLLIDEIDKSDIDLPNDLLTIFEEGKFVIPELERLDTSDPIFVKPYGESQTNERVPISNGQVQSAAFPLVVMTSNNEREFPPAFLRRCLRLTMQQPDDVKLRKIVEAQLGEQASVIAEPLIRDFLLRRERGDLATDQLLNAIYLVSRGINVYDKDKLIDTLLKYLTGAEAL